MAKGAVAANVAEKCDSTETIKEQTLEIQKRFRKSVLVAKHAKSMRTIWKARETVQKLWKWDDEGKDNPQNIENK